MPSADRTPSPSRLDEENMQSDSEKVEDDTKYPSGFGLFSLVIALVLSMFLVRSSAQYTRRRPT
jgi:hypothetical protein